ncbi:MAG: hypothetical protein ABR912_12435 [Terracidiphilus sp.]|jgi:DNA-binding transcriptional regulator YiaG
MRGFQGFWRGRVGRASTAKERESGAKRPSSMALKLLDIVEKHGLKMLV